MTDLVLRTRRRLEGRAAKSLRSSLRHAAVLLPILVGDAPEKLLLTRRSDKLRRQPGDIAFPGGAVDPEDPTALHAALRESREEVGLLTEHVNVLGQMDERATVTGFRITPFVGAVDGPYPFRTNHEVDVLIEVPIETLRDPDILEVENRRMPDGSMSDVYHYHFEGHDIWGITGQLIKDFLDLIA